MAQGAYRIAADDVHRDIEYVAGLTHVIRRLMAVLQARDKTMSVRSLRVPSLSRWLPGLSNLGLYDPSWLSRDLAAGLSVAAIGLPVGIAYAELAGVPAVIGIYSAIFPLLAYALFGSSRQLMVGPDAATCLMVAATLEPLAAGNPERYLALVPTLALIVGALYLVAGLLRLGFIANFLSQPILTGYLNGIAAIIIVGQLPKLFGYTGVAEEFLPRLLEFPERLGHSHLPTLSLGLASIALLLLLRRMTPSIPAALAVVAGGITAVAVFGLRQRGVAVTGNVPAGLPQMQLVWFDAATYRSLLQDAAGIVLISFTSGVLTAKSFARRNGYEIDANRELIAFGASNLTAGLAQGFTVTGADSRTAVNDAMGGRTQLVGIVAAVAMLLVLLLLTEPLSLVPTAALAAVILVAAVGLFDLSGLRELLRMSPREGLLSIGTTAGVLLLGVLPGVVLAVVLSLAWLLALASRPADAVLGRVPRAKGLPQHCRLPCGADRRGAALVPLQWQPGLLQRRLFLHAPASRDRACGGAGGLGRRRCQPDQPRRCNGGAAGGRAAGRTRRARHRAGRRPGQASAAPLLRPGMDRNLSRKQVPDLEVGCACFPGTGPALGPRPLYQARRQCRQPCVKGKMDGVERRA